MRPRGCIVDNVVSMTIIELTMHSRPVSPFGRSVAEAINALLAADAARAARFADFIQALRSVPVKLEHNEREAAAHLLVDLSFEEGELLGTDEIIERLFAELGLEDLVEKAYEERAKARKEAT